MKTDNLEIDKVQDIITGNEVTQVRQRRTLGMIWKDDKLQPHYIDGAPNDEGSMEKLIKSGLLKPKNVEDKATFTQDEIDQISDELQDKPQKETESKVKGGGLKL